MTSGRLPLDALDTHPGYGPVPSEMPRLNVACLFPDISSLSLSLSLYLSLSESVSLSVCLSVSPSLSLSLSPSLSLPLPHIHRVPVWRTQCKSASSHPCSQPLYLSRELI